jgi:hypothetical protein
MALYTFYPCRDDGTSSTFETCELLDDGEAFLRAQKVAQDHQSCSHVAIWCGARKVRTHPSTEAAGVKNLR